MPFFFSESELLLLPELTQGQGYMRRVANAKLASPHTKSGIGSV